MKEKKNLTQPPRKRKKRPFKAFANFLTFLILIGFSGFVFYRGWIQISIPENHYALAFTKTQGYDKQLMKAGEFYWRWENLFPTYMTLHVFELPWVTNEIEISGTLPSGEAYASILPEGASFQFKVKAVLRYRFNPDNIEDFIRNDHFQYADISNWYETVPLKAESAAKGALISALALPDISISQAEESISAKLQKQNPPLEIQELNILNWEIPDAILYNTTREIYLKGIETTRAQLSELEKKNTELESQLTNKMELLKDYGEVLTEYPVLLQYFNLEKEKIDPMIFNWEEKPSPTPES